MQVLWAASSQWQFIRPPADRLRLTKWRSLATTSAVAHSLAMVSFVVVFLGACGLVRRIAAADRIAFSGLVTYGVACVAVLIATAVSGFIVPDMMRLHGARRPCRRPAMEADDHQHFSDQSGLLPDLHSGYFTGDHSVVGVCCCEMEG